MTKPFKLRVDWCCQEAYRDPVVVELLVMDEEPITLGHFADAPTAAGYARKWLESRGFQWKCDINTAERQGWTHITLFPTVRTTRGPVFDPAWCLDDE